MIIEKKSYFVFIFHRRPIFRYQAVLMRERFDLNRNVNDPDKARELLDAGELELFQKQHYQPKKCTYTLIVVIVSCYYCQCFFFSCMILVANSPGGCAFEREVIPPDWVLDFWHPLEKAQYPEYFARRELRKKEYVEWWEKKYGKPSAEDSAHH